MPILKPEQLEELRQFDTPTISNAIDMFEIRKCTEGFTNYTIKQMIPQDKPLVGYAMTAKMSAMNPETKHQHEMKWEYYQKVKETPNPTISVIQDIDPYPIGSFWGDVQSSIHMALGCYGVITNGGIRDLDELERSNFYCFASSVLVSEAYIHIEAYDCPVTVGGLTVNPGDLIHADRHGVCLIPFEIADKVADACRERFFAEEPVLSFCRGAIVSGTQMDVNELRKQREIMSERLKSSLQNFKK
ncbi:MAG: RraA family protein [Clostridiaceae bacterium]|nr:RraA family protein [Clostridiaceae bacterium]